MSSTDPTQPVSSPAGAPIVDAAAANPPTTIETPASPPEATRTSDPLSDDGATTDAAADESGDASGEDAPAGAAPPGPDGPRKKRRRRRRKKHGEGPTPEGVDAEANPGEASATGEATDVAGPIVANPQRPKEKRRERKPHERDHRYGERERPAFSIGDVVFGKVIEVTDEVLFIDLSGKGRALFDLRELLISDEDDARAEEAERAEQAEEARERRALEATASVVDTLRSAGAAAEHAPEGDLTTEQPGEPPAPSEPAAAEAAAAAVDEATPLATPAPPSAVTHERRIVTASDRVVAAEPEPEPEPEPEALASGAVAPAGVEVASSTGESASTEEHASSETSASTEEGAPTEVAPPAAGAAREPIRPRVILEPGAPFVGVVHNDGGRGGCVVLTHHPKRVSRSKPIVAAALRDKGEVVGLVTGAIKGGVEVDIDGLRAFVPGSHMDLHLGAPLAAYVGKRFAFHVTQYGKRGRDVVLSRRAMLEVEAKQLREAALARLEMGSVVEGVVRSVVQFGAFIDLGGVEGLVPLSEMSHDRGDHPHDVFKVHETVQVKVLRLDEKGKLWLSRKAAIPDPWAGVAARYAVNSRHTGKVARLQPFGAFIELEPAVDGLVHTEDLSLKRIEHPSEVLKVGDSIEVVVTSVDAAAHRIALFPAPTGDAAGEIPQRVALHKVVKVAVVSTELQGLHVRVLGAVGRSSRGYITAAATGTLKGADLRKLFPIGKELEAKVIDIDPRRGEVKLSLKAVSQDTERNAYQQYRAQVKREAKFGTFADLLQKTLKTDKPDQK